MAKCYASTIIKIAEAEVGYLEKKTNKNLDSKTANAGYNNYTKYARDLDNLGDFYNGKKNGYSWCDMFVDWCFIKAFGRDTAQNLLLQPNKSLGAGCKYSANYYKTKGQYYTSPKVGDQIFFKNSSGVIYHTGLVYKVDNTYVYTIEGNTSSTSGVVENGGSVEKKKYKLNYNRIDGYGRPKYDEEPKTVTTTTTKKVDYDVKNLQAAINKDLKPNPKLAEDNKLGSKTKAYLKKVIIKKPVVGSNKKYPNIIKFVQGKVGVTKDGCYGKNSLEKVKNYQRKHGLKVDGIVGYNTLMKMIG